MAFIQENGATIAVAVVLLVIALLALRHVLRNRKAGGCGCGCSGCANAGNCGAVRKE